MFFFGKRMTTSPWAQSDLKYVKDLHDRILRPKNLHTLKMRKSQLFLITIKQHKFQYEFLSFFCSKRNDNVRFQ